MKNLVKFFSLGTLMLSFNTGCHPTKKSFDYSVEMLMENVQIVDRDGDGKITKYEKSFMFYNAKDDDYLEKMLDSKDFKKMIRLYEKTCSHIEWKE